MGFFTADRFALEDYKNLTFIWQFAKESDL